MTLATISILALLILLQISIIRLVWRRAQLAAFSGAYRSGGKVQRAADIAKLRHLRWCLENETGGLTTEQAYLLCDVCSALRLEEGEIQHVLGAAYWMIIDAPVGDDMFGGIDY
jgi:hypothetical protein